jgi:DNA-binding transcriptional MerR regulator
MIAEAIRLSTQTFRIGAVSRLTGVTTSLIRVWERRYEAVKPMRTDTGNRLYTQDDIARLALIKQLLDSGDAIGSVASLSLTDLEKRVEAMGNGVQHKPQRESIRVVAVGHALTARASSQRGELGELDFVGIFHDPEDLRNQPDTLKIDVIMIEYPYVKGDTATEIQKLINETGAKGVVVVYGFGSKRNVRRLDLLPVITLRAPADISELRRACLAASARGVLSEPEHQLDVNVTPLKLQPRRYSDAELARIATLSTVIECECPHHLADLVLCLASFEQYSADCTNRNEDDAAMHRYLHATSAQARSLLETALGRLIEVEGLEV